MHRIVTNRPSAKTSEGAAPPTSESAAFTPLSVRIPIAVKMTGIGRSKLYELIQEGEIEVVKIGSATLIPVDSLHGLLNRNRRSGI
jgi:excisionase family DNA binding protein